MFYLVEVVFEGGLLLLWRAVQWVGLIKVGDGHSVKNLAEERSRIIIINGIYVEVFIYVLYSNLDLYRI